LSLSEGTKQQYLTTWNKFKQFNNAVFPNTSYLPIDTGKLLYFLAHLETEGISCSSLYSAISALNFVNKAVTGIDITNNFWVNKFLQGMRKEKPTQDVRLPITPSILYKLCDASEKLFSVQVSILLKSMFLLAFHGFLRIGEITVTSISKINANLLHLSQLSMSPEEQTVTITFNKYKHSSSAVPFQLNISSKNEHYSLIRCLAQYIKLRGMDHGPLFRLGSNPITRNFFTNHLQQCLRFSQLDLRTYKSHSFRIGAATTALMKGYTHEQVQRMGRWQSEAFKKYLRVNSFNVSS
jgi:hypothetical protein